MHKMTLNELVDNTHDVKTLKTVLSQDMYWILLLSSRLFFVVMKEKKIMISNAVK